MLRPPVELAALSGRWAFAPGVFDRLAESSERVVMTDTIAHPSNAISVDDRIPARLSKRADHLWREEVNEDKID